MSIRETIMQKINQKKRVRKTVTDETELYRDLNFDSLSFICLLIEIETLFSITFDVSEMESCIRVGHLIELTEQKSREDKNDSKPAHQPQ